MPERFSPELPYKDSNTAGRSPGHQKTPLLHEVVRHRRDRPLVCVLVPLAEAQFLRTKIIEGIREQAPGGRAFTPLAPTTLAIRKFRGFGGTKALLVHGDLRNSITVTRDGDRVLVGVHRTAKGRTGQPLINVAAAHELGSRPIVMKLTPKARAFLHAAFRKAGLDSPSTGRRSTGIAIVQVPARPFLSPVFERYAQPDEVSRRFLERVATNLKGDFGAG